MDEQTKKLWALVLADMEKKVSKANFLTLFRHTVLLSFADNIATIASPSTMIGDMLEKRFQADIKASFDTHTKANVDLLFITKAVTTTASDEKTGPLFSAPEPKAQPPTLGHLPRVRAEYTFATFAVSGSNQLAFSAASNVAAHLGTTYNPLFIYGPVGVGKTHLMHALANDVYHKDPSKKIIYLTSEEFTNEVVEAIRSNATAQMKRRFRSAILLLIDDIQFIEGKERVQEELFHTFNILIDNGAQICLSSDRPPQEIRKLEKRLSSRFAGGLTVDIEEPDFELKSAILLKKAEKYGHTLPIEVAKLLAERVKDARSLEGLLLRVITLAQSQGIAITLDLAEKAIGYANEEKRHHLHSDEIIQQVCEYYGVKTTQLKGPKRDASLVRARQVAMYLLKTELRLTLVEIGNLLGGRDHTTIMHGVDKMVTLVDNKEPIAQDIQGITRALHE